MPVSKKPRKEPTIESMLTDLETLVSTMESGQMSLEQSVEAYRQGAELASVCQQKLSTIREQISVLDAQTQTLIDHPIEHLT